MCCLCALCQCVLENLDALGTLQLTENDLELSHVVHMVVRVLLAYGVHGQAKFTAIIGFGGHLNAGQQCECELWDTNDNTIRGHSCHI
jgi:hypothetical protein